MKRFYYIARLVIFIAIAILIAIFSEKLLGYLPYIVGSVMIIFGVEGIIIPIAQDPRKFFTDAKLYLGHVDLLLGIVVLISVRDFDQICIIWGTWTVVRESFDLYEIAHKAYHQFPAVLSFALSITEIVFSVMLILNASEHHALTHIYLLIPEFVVNGLSPLFFEIHKKRRKKKTQQTEQK